MQIVQRSLYGPYAFPICRFLGSRRYMGSHDNIIYSPKTVSYTHLDVYKRQKGTISAMISHLEKEGFLEQRVNPDNMRERNLHLTPKGEFVCERHTAFDRRTTCDYLLAI